jgi:ADP-ribose pyrophosphatase YjhB (NUDIX family)
VHLGERLEEATKRELMEECGIEIALTDVIEVIERMVHDPDGRVQYHYVIVDYLARWVRGEPTPSPEALEARWVAPAEFPELAMTRGTAEVILRVLEKGRTAGVI